MKRILFLILWVNLVFGPQAQGAIEVFADGHKFDSLKAYQDSKKPPQGGNPPIPATLDSQQEDYVRKEAQEMGIKVDFSKVKTFQVNQQKIPDNIQHQLYVLSVEDGMVNALKDFYQTWDQADLIQIRKISSDQLQEAIQQAVTASKEPKLLISEPGKVRIMALKK